MRKSMLYETYGFVCSGECSVCRDERAGGGQDEEDSEAEREKDLEAWNRE